MTYLASPYLMSGASGQIAQVFRHWFRKQSIKLIGIYFQHLPRDITPNEVMLALDLSKEVDLPNHIQYRSADHFLHLAAATHIDACQQDAQLGSRSRAWLSNVTATEQVIRFCQKYQKKLIYLSTECVFDNSRDSFDETDLPRPLSWYGITKRIAEEKIIQSGLEYLIVRSTLVYGLAPPTGDFIQSIWHSLHQKTPTLVVRNQWLTPIYAFDLVKGIMALIHRGATGIYHIAGSSITTPYQIAQRLAIKMPKRILLPQSVTLTEFFGTQRAKLRLSRAVLDSQKFIRLTGFTPLTIEEGLDRMLEN